MTMMNWLSETCSIKLENMPHGSLNKTGILRCGRVLISKGDMLNV